MKLKSFLKETPLFLGVPEAEMPQLLSCFGAAVQKVPREDILLLRGDRPTFVGIVLSGRIHVVKEDVDGGRILVGAMERGDLFAEALCCAGIAESPVTILADTDTEIARLHFERILTTCPKNCSSHQIVISNMLMLTAKKNLFLQNRLEVVGQRSIRAKVLRFFSGLGAQPDSVFEIPYNREELADFLCADRTALSHELARMKKDGLIDYRKNRFTVFRQARQ